jgi:hypothetical protein
MWKCERHIPTSKVYPEIIAKCPACGFARPDAAYRPPMFPEEEKPVVRLVPPPVTVPPPPAKAFSEDMSLGQAQRDLDEIIIADLVKAAEKLKKSRVKAPTPPAPKPVVEDPVDVAPASKRPKDIPNAQKSKAHLCPGPKCRKVSRRNSPYCSKPCSDRCLRLRKKFSRATLTEQEARWLNTILLTLGAWGWVRDEE